MVSETCSLFASENTQWPPLPKLHELAAIAREDALEQRHLTLQDLVPDKNLTPPSGTLLLYRSVRFLALREVLGRRLAAAFEYQSGRRVAEQIAASTVEDLLQVVADLGYALEVVSLGEDTAVFDEIECPTCRGLPNIGEYVCCFEAGFIARGLERVLDCKVRVREVMCWAAGDDRCRFVAQLTPHSFQNDLMLPAESEAQNPLEMVAALAGTAGEAVRLAEELQYKNQVLEVMATTDALTGVANRRALMDRLRIEVQNTRLTGQPLSLAVLDIDNFKAVNDQWGHDMGDQVLVRIARALMKSVRDSDHVARYGGEEFTILCPGQTLNRAMQIVERVRETIDNDPSEPHITISGGVASIPPEDADVDILLNAADQALYTAKRSGKNMVLPSVKYLK